MRHVGRRAVRVVAFVGIGILWLRRTWLIVRVDGNSMYPTFRDGDRLLARRTRMKLGHSQIVIAGAPDQPGRGSFVVKRIVAVSGDRMPGHLAPTLGPAVPEECVLVVGDNRQAGLVPEIYRVVPEADVVAVVRRPLKVGVP